MTYYGSDLNRFIDERCTREMTCNNIDCLLIKVSQHRIRIIESKHTREGMPTSQRTALQVLKDILDATSAPWEVKVFVVRGDYPYETAEVREVGTAAIVTLSQAELIRWLNFEDTKHYP